MQPFMVVFIDTKGPALLGRYDDKGVARRAWEPCKFGAALAQSDGTVLQFKGGTAKQAEKRLEAFAKQVAREQPQSASKRVCEECHEPLPDHAIPDRRSPPEPRVAGRRQQPQRGASRTEKGASMKTKLHARPTRGRTSPPRRSTASPPARRSLRSSGRST